MPTSVISFSVVSVERLRYDAFIIHQLVANRYQSSRMHKSIDINNMMYRFVNA